MQKLWSLGLLWLILPTMWLLTAGLFVFLPQKAYIFTFLLSSRLFIEPHELLSRVCHKCIEQQRLDDPVLDKVSLSLQQKNVRYFRWTENAGALVCVLCLPLDWIKLSHKGWQLPLRSWHWVILVSMSKSSAPGMSHFKSSSNFPFPPVSVFPGDFPS